VHTFAARHVVVLPLLLLAAATACARTPEWQAVKPDDLSPSQRAQAASAEAARAALAAQLLAELTDALGKGGPKAAIEVCHGRAPALASAIGEQHALRIGRTSRRLRNAKNTAPDWATAHVAADGGEPVTFAGPAGELGALYPIRLMPQCVQCHGNPEDIAAEAKSALAELYPGDRATGFAPGELRGWFWVEVPRVD